MPPIVSKRLTAAHKQLMAMKMAMNDEQVGGMTAALSTSASSEWRSKYLDKLRIRPPLRRDQHHVPISSRRMCMSDPIMIPLKSRSRSLEESFDERREDRYLSPLLMSWDQKQQQQSSPLKKYMSSAQRPSALERRRDFRSEPFVTPFHAHSWWPQR
jgi:hypothetical protein